MFSLLLVNQISTHGTKLNASLFREIAARNLLGTLTVTDTHGTNGNYVNYPKNAF